MSGKKENPAAASFAPWLGVFETLRVERGVAQNIDEHWESLREATRALGLKIGCDFRAESRSLDRRSGRLRWIVERDESRMLFTVEPMRVKPAFTLALAPQRVGSANWDARYKTLSYLTHWQARRSVRADEALLLNERGNVASGAMSNLFWTQDGTLFTPPLSAGCRNGVIRRLLLQRVAVVERECAPAELEQANALYLTNSWIGLRPVSRLGKRRFALERSRDTLARLQECLS